jgi:RNA polymerase sigma-70 factor (ECF subfamily)
MGNRTDAEDILQGVWLCIHRVRHAYRQGEPLRPWVYSIASWVRVDNYRKRQRIASRESSVAEIPEPPTVRSKDKPGSPTFEDLVAALPESQREVLTILKVNQLSSEEVARGISSTVGALKQKTHGPISGCAICWSKLGSRSRRTREWRNDLPRY